MAAKAIENVDKLLVMEFERESLWGLPAQVLEVGIGFLLEKNPSALDMSVGTGVVKGRPAQDVHDTGVDSREFDKHLEHPLTVSESGKLKKSLATACKQGERGMIKNPTKTRRQKVENHCSREGQWPRLTAPDGPAQGPEGSDCICP